MKKFIGALFLLGVALLPGRADASSICASTTNCSFTIDTASIAAGSAPYGNVSLSLIGSTVHFVVDLNGLGNDPGLRLIDTGSHNAFTFNFNGISGPVTVSNFQTTLGTSNPLTLISLNTYSSGLTYSDKGGAGSNSPYGSFSWAITSNCTNGGGCGVNYLSFDVTRSGGFTDVNQLIAPSTGGNPNALFAMDVTKNGTTGAIAVTQSGTTITINSVPEPQSAALLGSGLVALAFAAKKLRRK